MFSSRKSSAPAAAGGAADPQFNYVTALLHGDGTNGAQNNTFLDSSTNNFTITRNGTPTQGSFSPYGSLWSNYFDGSSYLTTPSSSNLTLGTGASTVECWIYTSTSSAQRGIFNTGSTTGCFELYLQASTNNFIYNFYGASGTTNGNIAVPLNTWVHVAAVRINSTTMYLFVNGVKDTTFTLNAYDTGVGTVVQVGSGFTKNFNGYISNFRIVVGTAVYTSSFTPPTTPLTAISGTQLLTCQSNRFIDNSTNAFTLTISGSPQVQRFNPFLPTSSQAYSTSVYGGSGYLNGSSDWLQSSHPSMNATWTIECWVYRTTGSAYQSLVFLNSGGVSGIIVYIDTSNYLTVTDGVNGQSAFSNLSVPINAWTHIAVVRSGGTTTGYVNGVVAGSNSFTPASVSLANIGFYAGASPLYLTGYISNVRVVNGTAVYTSAFTPPTAPLTAITNTSLLVNMTNAGIYDNAMMEDWLTVGSAQISTSVKKYGTGSLYFNGTTDYLSTINKPIYSFGTGDFTVECWAYLTSSSGATYGQQVVGKSNGSTGWAIIVNRTSSGYSVAATSADGSSLLLYQSGTLSASTWYHIAWSRTSGTAKLFLNGTQVASATDTSSDTNTNTLWIASQNGGQLFPGYIDDLRITTGYGRYTASFTPPTAAFPNY